MKRKYLNVAIMAVALAGFGQVASADVITDPESGVTTITENFDNISSLYTAQDSQGSTFVSGALDGLTWTNTYIMNGNSDTNYYTENGYNSGLVTSDNVAYNGNGNVMTIMSPNGLLTNGSAYFTAVYDSFLPLTIQGLDKNGNLISTDVINTSINDNPDYNTPQLIPFNFTDAYGVKITADAANGVHDSHFGNTSGSQFAMDNLSATISPVPEPEQWAMLLLGLPLVLRLAKRQGNFSI